MTWELILSLLERFGFPAVTAFAAGWWVVRITTNNREDIAQLTRSHRENISQLATDYRQDIKQFYSDMKKELERLMHEHSLEREEARKSWQNLYTELKHSVDLLTHKLNSNSNKE